MRGKYATQKMADKAVCKVNELYNYLEKCGIKAEQEFSYCEYEQKAVKAYGWWNVKPLERFKLYNMLDVVSAEAESKNTKNIDVFSMEGKFLGECPRNIAKYLDKVEVRNPTRICYVYKLRKKADVIADINNCVIKK